MNVKLAACALIAFVCAQDDSLVLHLKFDDQKVDDGAKAVGKVDFAEGKKGGALKLDGTGHVEVANSDALDKVQADSYTVMA